MSQPSSGLGYFPLPFHHPGWRSSPHHDFFSHKSSSSCLYCPGRKDQDSSCLEAEAEKFSPGCRGEGPLLELERKEPVLFIRQSRTRKSTFRPSSLPKLSLTTFPKQVSDQASSAADGNLCRGSLPSSPSYFADGGSCEVSVRLKPGHGPKPSRSKEEEEEEEEWDKEEEEAKKNDLEKSSSLEFPILDEASPGSKPKSKTVFPTAISTWMTSLITSLPWLKSGKDYWNTFYFLNK